MVVVRGLNGVLLEDGNNSGWGCNFGIKQWVAIKRFLCEHKISYTVDGAEIKIKAEIPIELFVELENAIINSFEDEKKRRCK